MHTSSNFLSPPQISWIGSGSTSAAYDEMCSVICNWLQSEPFQDLCRLESLEPLSGDVHQDLAYLTNVLKYRWNFRKGDERETVQYEPLNAHDSARILHAAENLHLVLPAKPQKQSYDFVLVLGGLVHASVDRLAATLDIFMELSSPRVIDILTAPRELSMQEQYTAQSMGLVEGWTEAGALHEASGAMLEHTEMNVAPQYFNQPGQEYVKGAWRGSSVVIRLTSARALGRNERATTRDTLIAWAKDRTKAVAGSSILVITSPIYVSYQGMEAISVLGGRYDAGWVETVGVRQGSSGKHAKEPQAYLQEILATVQAMERYVVSAKPHGT